MATPIQKKGTNKKKVIAIKPIVMANIKYVLIGTLIGCVLVGIAFQFYQQNLKADEKKKQNFAESVEFKKEFEDHIKKSLQYQSLSEPMYLEIVQDCLETGIKDKNEIMNVLRSKYKTLNQGVYYRLEITIESSMDFKKRWKKEKADPHGSASFYLR